jgi:hypothetical protein
MKFSDFKTNADLLNHFGLGVTNQKFVDFEAINPINIATHLVEDIDFALANRGDTDMEFYACEFFILPLLKEAWKRNPKIKLFSHPQIRYDDMILVPDYVVTPKDRIGLNTFTKPLLITVEAKNDDYEKGWADIYRQLVVARAINQNNEVPIYAIVSIGTGWQIGKLDGNLIYRHPTPLGLDNANKILGVLDFIFADCVKTAEKFDLF